MSKSIIKKEIIRKIRTADFEQLDVILGIEEEIEWENDEERKEKTKKLTGLLIEDFRETYNRVNEELKTNRCISSVNTNIEKKNSSNNTKKEEDDEFDI